MKVDSLARLLRKFATTGISLRQINAALLLMTLMIPIASPIPAWAYSLDVPQAPETSRSIAGPGNELALTTVATRFSNSATELFSATENQIRSLGTSFESSEPGKPFLSIVADSFSNISAVSSFIRTNLDETPPAKSSAGHERTKAPTVEPEASEDKKVADPVSNSTAREFVGGLPGIETAKGPLPVAPVASTSLLIDDDENQVIRESSYSPENNVGNPAGRFEADAPAEARTTKIKNRAGIGNFSFGVPIAALSGRGLDASIGMTYNSRVWNRTQTASGFLYTYNVDKNWIAPGFSLGYGSLSSHFVARPIRMTNTSGPLKWYNEVVPDGYTDTDGTRHQFECRTRVQIPGTNTANDVVNNKYCSEYATKDGTFVRVQSNGYSPITPYQQADKTYYAYTAFTLIHSDGTKVSYSGPGSQFGGSDSSRDHYPTIIQDSNGNQITIGYLNNTDKISAVQDTVGRQIKFYYENPNSPDPKLTAVTVPGFNGGVERQTVRFYYEDDAPLTSQGRFSGTVVAPATGTYRALKYVYFPATQSGFRYDYHGLGMISKITKLMGMTVSTDSTATTGTVTSADSTTTAATSEYNYVSDGGSSPLTDVPKFNLRTDSWKAYPSDVSSVTQYDSEESAGSTNTTTVTVDQGNFVVEYKTEADSATGYTSKTSITQVSPGLLPKAMSTTTYGWDIRPTGNIDGGYFTWLKRMEVTNDANQTQTTEFDVDEYNNTKLVRECAIAAPGDTCTELRRTESSYIKGDGWINNQLLRLPESIVKKVNGTAVAKTVFAYDGISQLQATPGVVQHDPAYNPNQGTHMEGHWECDGQPGPPRCDDGTGTGHTIPAQWVPVEVPNADPRYYFRGNLTKVTSFANAMIPSAADDSVRVMEYDMTGNVIKASMSCCNVKTIEYDPANQYAYPTKETKGPVGTQLVTMTSYDKYTGMVVSAIDENNLQTNFEYDSATLRQTRTEFPNGAWTQFDINNTQFPYYAKTTSSLDAARSVSSWTFFDGAGRAFRNRRLTANGYLTTDVEFDSIGHVKRTYNPYTVAALNVHDRPEDIKFTEVTRRDALSRVLETTLADGSKASALYSGNIATMTDPAGKKRRQEADALGRIKRVDEPDANGNFDTATAPVTNYVYDGNDNLTTVTQTEGSITQERVFEYDSLSRLLRERQVEATPTLDASGVKGTAASMKWTGVYKYTPDGLLDWGVDSRGVKTDLSYDLLNRLERVQYSGDPAYITPSVDYIYGENRPDDPVLGRFYNKGRLTTVRTEEINTSGGQFTPKTIQTYDYNKAGEVVNHNQTIDQQVYNLHYEYNLAGQVIKETYPSGRAVNTTIDNFGGMQTIADSQRTYLNGVTATYDVDGMSAQITLGNGTIETFRLNERSQLTSQTLRRGSEVLQKFEYAYGQMDATGEITSNSNNGQLARIEAFIGSAKQRTQKFSYDSIGRLSKSEEYRGDTNALTYRQVFDYDRFGNLYRKAASNPVGSQQNPIPFTPLEETTPTSTGDIDKNTNRFKTGTIYDEAGEVITDSKFRNMGFVYDANGRVVKATKVSVPDAVTVYDALGKRVAAKVNGVWQYTIYDAFGQLVAEYGAATEGLGGVKYLQQDYQGSVRTATNSSGLVVSRTDYQAFGETIGSGVGLRSLNQAYGGDASARQSYGLTENDEASGQQHTWFRKLETGGGRWSSPDPYKGSISVSDPQTFNRYSYVNNNPINGIDPSGLMQPCEFTLPDGSTIPGVIGSDGKCYASLSGGFDAGTSYGSEGDIDVTNQNQRLEWQSRRMRNPYGSWIDSGFVLKGSSPYTPILTRNPRAEFIKTCIQTRIDGRVRDLDATRDNEVTTNLLWSMNLASVGPTGSSLRDLAPEKAVRDPNVAAIAGVAGMVNPNQLGPIGSAVGILVQGAIEGTKGHWDHNQHIAKAKETTADDQEICEGRANANGL